jgi:cytochrome P450
LAKHTTVVLSDAAAIKACAPRYFLGSKFNNYLRSQEVTTSRSRFPKPVANYEVLLMFGRNIVASEGDEWKKYRRIAAPTFSDVRLHHFPEAIA